MSCTPSYQESLTLSTAKRYCLRLLLQKHIILLSLETGTQSKEEFLQLLQKLPNSEQETWKKNYHSYPQVTAQRLQRRCWLEQKLTFLNGHKQCLQGRYGKPTLRKRAFFFNLSHSKKLTVLALFHLPLGIDIESLDSRKHQVLFTALHPKEQDYLKHFRVPPQTHQAFLRIWTRQEAFAKLSGQAISRTLGRQPLNWINKPPLQSPFFHEETYANHYLCLVSRRPFKCLWWAKDQAI